MLGTGYVSPINLHICRSVVPGRAGGHVSGRSAAYENQAKIFGPCLTSYRGQPKAGTGYKMLLVPFVFSMSRFQGPSFRCNRIVVIVTLLEAIKGIPDSTIIIFEGTKTSTIFTRDYFMSENLRVDI